MLDAKPGKKGEVVKPLPVIEFDPTECPFREFKDTELSSDYWGMGTAALKTAFIMSKAYPKTPADHVWVDEQTQPLPRSVRQYLHGWVRAEDLALARWEAEVSVFDEANDGKMSIADIQFTHAQVLLRSAFCRRVLAACYILERLENFTIEHQWENFNFALGPEGWRARYHIYSPGMKSGGGAQHRPGLSKNGCYLVRLFYLGLWRCVWVNDQVPVDATDAPLLPFCPIQVLQPPAQPAAKPTKESLKAAPPAPIPPVVHLWPLLICKALLKLAAPDMNSDEDDDRVEDETVPEFSLWHSLTGSMHMIYMHNDNDFLWDLLVSEVPAFTWDEDEETVASTVKSKATKKPNPKENAVVRRRSIAVVQIRDTKLEPAFALPGITPAHEFQLLVTMTRDIPLKKPLPEPEIPLWKEYRWVDWARHHGLYEAYDCPRTKFVKVTGLLKQSHAPHLIQLESTESISHGFIQKHESTKGITASKKDKKEQSKPSTQPSLSDIKKEELRQWVLFNSIAELINSINIIYFPSMFQFTSAAISPPIRITKAAPNKAIDVAPSKAKPFYLQIDSSEENTLYFSLNALHPRILSNARCPMTDYKEPSYVVLEKFQWFEDCDLPVAKGFIQTRGYDTCQVTFLPGRHFCRIWVHSPMNWHLMLVSDSSLLLGSRDVIQAASVLECPWASKFLNNLGSCFNTWIRLNRTAVNVIMADREFYRSYLPDLTWDEEKVGYKQPLLHWMFRKALQSRLSKIPNLTPPEYLSIYNVLRYYFCDPDFGLPDKQKPPPNLRVLIAADPCDCTYPEAEEIECLPEQLEENQAEYQQADEVPKISSAIMEQLLHIPTTEVPSILCELATEEVPCEVLNEEREKLIRKHEAATYLQAMWRGTRARQILKNHIMAPPEVLKLISDNLFGNVESLSALMNEFFCMYPGAKSAYSVSSALGGVNGLLQFSGTTSVSVTCRWIPFFQGIFICHAPVKVHLDIHSSLGQQTVAIYNNDTEKLLSQAYNTHITFDIEPNANGYSVMGHGTLKQAGNYADASWQLTVLSSVDKAFHVCDNNLFEGCKELPIPHATKLHLDEIFVPNSQNILGGIRISVTSPEYISFRAAAVDPELEMEAILKSATVSNNEAEAEMEVVARCAGVGEIYWPYIKLEPAPPSSPAKGAKSVSHFQLNSARSMKAGKGAKQATTTSRTKLNAKTKAAVDQIKLYVIEVIAPNGWPMTLEQWKRVDEIRNSHEIKSPAIKKTPVKEKQATSAKDKAPPKGPPAVARPRSDDPYVELECALDLHSGNIAQRDDTREELFRSVCQSWEAMEPGRNHRGSLIREEFRKEFLEMAAPEPSVSHYHMYEFMDEEHLFEEDKAHAAFGAPSPSADNEAVVEETEPEEEVKLLKKPECLKDKFIPLYYVPFCTKELEGESVLITADKAEAAKRDREARIEAAYERMRELQAYNEAHILQRQKVRGRLFENLFLDGHWKTDVTRVLEERDDAIAQEALARSISASKKKQDSKKK